MHEYGLSEGILQTVLRRAEGRQVERVRVRIGVRHAAHAGPMGQAFTLVASGTVAADAVLELVTVPVQLACQDCGVRDETTDLFAVCPRCESDRVELTGGDEITLVKITYVTERRPGQEPGPEADAALRAQ